MVQRIVNGKMSDRKLWDTENGPGFGSETNLVDLDSMVFIFLFRQTI